MVTIMALFVSCSIEYKPKLMSQKHYSNVKAISDVCACISMFLKQIKVSTKLKTPPVWRDTAFLRNAKIALSFFLENVQSRNSLRMKLCSILLLCRLATEFLEFNQLLNMSSLLQEANCACV